MSAPAPLLGEKQTSGGRLAATDFMSTHASCPIVRRFNVWRTLLRAKLGSSEAIRRLVDLGLAEGEKMNNRRLTLLALFLILSGCSLIVGGLVASLVMSIMAFRDGARTSGIARVARYKSEG